MGGDTSDANVVKFSNDGRLMLLTTMDGHVHVLDSFRGTLVSCLPPTEFLFENFIKVIDANLLEVNVIQTMVNDLVCLMRFVWINFLVIHI